MTTGRLLKDLQIHPQTGKQNEMGFNSVTIIHLTVNKDLQELPGKGVWTSTLTVAVALTRVTCLGPGGGVDGTEPGGVLCGL